MRDEKYYVATLNMETVRVMVGQGYPLVCLVSGGSGSVQDLISMRLVVEVASAMLVRASRTFVKPGWPDQVKVGDKKRRSLLL
jgi:hypothetical protein